MTKWRPHDHVVTKKNESSENETAKDRRSQKNPARRTSNVCTLSRMPMDNYIVVELAIIRNYTHAHT